MKHSGFKKCIYEVQFVWFLDLTIKSVKGPKNIAELEMNTLFR